MKETHKVTGFDGETLLVESYELLKGQDGVLKSVCTSERRMQIAAVKRQLAAALEAADDIRVLLDTMVTADAEHKKAIVEIVKEDEAPVEEPPVG